MTLWIASSGHSPRRFVQTHSRELCGSAYRRWVWTRAELGGFARDGYVVAAGVVGDVLRKRALTRIDGLLAARPVPARHTGHLFFFEPVVNPAFHR